MKDECEQSVQQNVSSLRFREGEAPDLKASRLILEDVHRHRRDQGNS